MQNMPVSDAVLERVNAELVKSILETPDYIQKIIDQLLTDVTTLNTSSYYNDPDRNKPYFERILRRELRTIIENAVIKSLNNTYKEEIEKIVAESIEQQEKVEGSIAYAFAKIVKEKYAVRVNTTFQFEQDS